VTGAKSFTPAVINIGENSRLRLTFTAPPDTALTSFSFTDTLPAGVTVSNSTPPSATGCGTFGGAWPPAAGDTVIAATGGTIPLGATCTVDVYVTSNAGSGPGILYTNQIQPVNVSSAENRTLTSTISAGLTVRTVSTLSISKAFYPDIVNPNGLSTLTITLQNTGAVNLINVSLDDVLPGTTSNGVVVAPVPNESTTCTGGVITFPTSQTIRMTGGSIPAQVGGIPGICTIIVDVQGKSTNGATPATHTNTIPATNVIATIQGTPSTMNAQGPASDNLVVRNISLEVVKGFNPLLVYGGADSQMSITLRNPNSAAELVGISFVDNMPAGVMILVDPPNFDASDCDPPSGPPAVLTGTAGGSSFTFSGGYLAPGDQCTLTLNATLTVNGNRTNTIPAGAVTSFNGASNGTPTSATLTNLAGASVSKSFAPNPIASGLSSYSILTITIRTTATVALTGMGLVDNLPAGIEVAGGSAPAPTNGCGGTLSASPGDTTIQLSGGALGIGFETCSMTIPVAGANPGVYNNTIPGGTLTSDQNTTNVLDATASLTLTPFSLGNRVWYDTDNNGLLDGGESGIPGVRVELYRDNGTTPGVFDAGDTYLNFRNTDVNGFYRFDDLGPGDYIVVIPKVNFDTGGAPLAGYLSSGTSITSNGSISDSIGPDPDNDVDDDDNGVSTFTGTSVDYVSSRAVTLGPGGSEPTSENNPVTNPETGEAVDEQSNRTVDFGFYRLQLGNQIFQDVNENGAFDLGDAPLAGATVLLFAANGTTEINVGPDGMLGTTDDAPGGVTSTGIGTPGSPTGNYLFRGLPAGSYIVKVLPTGSPSTVDTANPGDTSNPNNNIDDNDNGVGVDSSTVSSNDVTLTPGSSGAASNNVITNATGTTYNPTVDFGYVTSFAKTLIGGEANHTADPEVTIGEFVTYQVSMVIPAGGLNNVQLVDTPQSGLAFADCLTITLPAGVTSAFANGACDALDGTIPGTSNPLIENSGGRITFDFGNITNTTGASQTVRVQYSLIVLDILANQGGDTLTNNVTWTWTGGSRTTNAPNVEIVEPELTIDKNATPTSVQVGGTVTFTIDLAHSAISSADAFDVVVTDRIPAALTYVPASLVVGGTATFTSSNFDTGTNTLTLVWDEIALGETASVTFDAVYLGPPPVVNVSSAEWTSLEIDPGTPGPPPVPVQRSPYNPSATERWYDPAAPAGVNNYVASDSVTVNAQGVDQAVMLPNTGFAPGKITALPEQPAEYGYSDLGELWLEVPNLKLKTQIVGVPKAGNGWETQWLWDQTGYLEGTAFPTWNGNSVITGHVFLSNGQPGPFVDIGNLKYGDQVIVSAFGQDYIYEVRSISYHKPDDVSRVIRHEKLPWITLLTCKDYDPGTDTYRNRIAVRAVLVSVKDK
jgi:LPXTG-site transpeptidase (sortase) family protein